jgi:hypothetical protein
MPERASMSDNDFAKTEANLWREVVQAQQAYTQSLGRLDAQALILANGDRSALTEELFAEAAELRRAAYAKYRQAMNQLARHLDQISG